MSKVRSNNKGREMGMELLNGVHFEADLSTRFRLSVFCWQDSPGGNPKQVNEGYLLTLLDLEG